MIKKSVKNYYKLNEDKNMCLFVFFKCSFLLMVGAVIFELYEVSMSNFAQFKFLSMTLKIERVSEKTNKF